MEPKNQGKYINFLRERRRRRRMSQNALAKEVGLTLTTINRYERGNRSIDRATIENIASVLGIENHEIFTRPEEDPCNLNMF